MKLSTLWSLRLGFSAKQAAQIETLGIEAFLNASFNAAYPNKLPAFLEDNPKTIHELKKLKQSQRMMDDQDGNAMRKARRQDQNQLKSWWIGKMRKAKYPLREKMVCFWHNHFVATSQKVKIPYFIYQHNMILRENAFGNFRELTRQMVHSNALINYLDNNDNVAGKINENLSRELLELFTLGIGNYSEADIKNGAKALAGLSYGEKEGMYRRKKEDNDTKSFLGQKGNLKANDIVDIIFQQHSAPYNITRKILQWFIYDNPPENLVVFYGDYLRKVDYEIEPFLQHVFSSEFDKKTAGSKIKDPLLYSLQLIDELQITDINNQQIAKFLKQQGMDLFDQPNVKGWDGGRAWLTSQIFLQRNSVSNLLCNGKMIGKGGRKAQKRMNKKTPDFTPKLHWNHQANSHQIIEELSSRLLFQVDDYLQEDLDAMLKYDFDASSKNADQAILRLFNFITKTPEFQLI